MKKLTSVGKQRGFLIIDPFMHFGAGNGDGTVAIISNRSTAHRDRYSNAATFSVAAPTLPTATVFTNIYYVWTWDDVNGFHTEYGPSACIDIIGDGSASYVKTVKLWIISGSTGLILNQNGTAVSEGSCSGTVTLTVTNNSAATVWTVTKTGDAITAVNGGTTIYADETVATGDSSGDGTIGNPYRTITRIISVNRASNQVWLLSSGTYRWGTAINPAAFTNFEVSAAPGDTVNIVTPSGTAGTLINPSQAISDCRFAGLNFTCSAYDQFASVLYAFVGDTFLTDVTLRNITSVGTGLGVYVNRGLSGLFVVDCNWQVGNSILQATDTRNQHVWIKKSTLQNLVSVAGSAFGGQAVDLTNVRYSGFVNSTITSDGAARLVRFITEQFTALPNNVWADGGSSLTSLVTLTGNTMNNRRSSNSGTVLEFTRSAGTEGPSKIAKCIVDNNEIDRWGFAVTARIQETVEAVEDVTWRNNVFGRDYGSTDRESDMELFLRANTGCTRTRVIVTGNDFYKLRYKAAWSGLQYGWGCFSATAGTDMTGCVFASNLIIVNVFDPAGVLQFQNDLDAGSPGWSFSENVYLRVDAFGVTSAYQNTAFCVDSNSTRDRTAWIGSALESNSQQFSYTDESVFRASHYDTNLYLTKYIADWCPSAVGFDSRGSPIRADNRLDYRGYTREAVSVAGRYDDMARNPQTGQTEVPRLRSRHDSLVITSSSTTHQVTMNPALGSTIAVGVIDSLFRTLSIADDRGNTWSVQYDESSAGFIRGYFFVARNVVAGPTVITITSSANTQLRPYTWEFERLATTGAITNATQPVSEGPTSAAVGTLTTTVKNCVMLMLVNTATSRYPYHEVTSEGYRLRISGANEYHDQTSQHAAHKLCPKAGAQTLTSSWPSQGNTTATTVFAIALNPA